MYTFLYILKRKYYPKHTLASGVLSKAKIGPRSAEEVVASQVVN